MDPDDITPELAAIAQALGATLATEEGDRWPMVHLPGLKMALRACRPWLAGRDRNRRLEFSAHVPMKDGRWQSLSHHAPAVTVARDRDPRAAAADITRRLIEPAKKHARAALQHDAARAAQEDAERVFRDDVADAIGAPLVKQRHHREEWSAPGLALDPWDITRATKGEPFRAEINLRSPHALRLICRIIRADQATKPTPAA